MNKAEEGKSGRMCSCLGASAANMEANHPELVRTSVDSKHLLLRLTTP